MSYHKFAQSQSVAYTLLTIVSSCIGLLVHCKCIKFVWVLTDYMYRGDIIKCESIAKKFTDSANHMTSKPLTAALCALCNYTSVQ